MKILTILGARPQFIKAAAVSRVIKRNTSLEELILHTGQHFDKNMSDIFFEQMQIPKPKFNLQINSLSHGAMTGRMLEGIEEVIKNEDPSIILVYGDTNSTLAGALAAKKMHKKLVHIEAGLRSFKMEMPEEVNRILTDRISDLLCCPTQTAIDNLKNENYEKLSCKMVLTGDVMMDAALFYGEFSKEKSLILNKINSNENFILCTLHRQENTDNIDTLTSIVSALNKINTKIPIVLPLHPRTKKRLNEAKIKLSFPTFDPVGYFDMIELLKNCSLVITDSGGLQKEAFYFKKNSLTMRSQTEWVELVENNFSRLVGSDTNKILNGVDEMLLKKNDFSLPLYGDGKASEIIVKELQKL